MLTNLAILVANLYDLFVVGKVTPFDEQFTIPLSPSVVNDLL